MSLSVTLDAWMPPGALFRARLLTRGTRITQDSGCPEGQESSQTVILSAFAQGLHAEVTKVSKSGDSE